MSRFVDSVADSQSQAVEFFSPLKLELLLCGIKSIFGHFPTDLYCPQATVGNVMMMPGRCCLWCSVFYVTNSEWAQVMFDLYM